MTRELKVGALLVIALAALASGIFLVGEKNRLFVLKNRYFIHFENVGGLATGNPVQLNGVNVGKVRSVALPQKVDEKLLTVWISMDRTYAGRVREDSLARIKTLGLLGDKYIEISSGSPAAPVIEVLGEISAAPPTDVDRLLTSGEDAVDNVVAISYSLRSILGRVDAGEGLLGELLMTSESGEKVKGSAIETLANIESISARLARGEGTIGTLLTDDRLASKLESSLVRLESILAQFESGEGALPALLSEPEIKNEMVETLASLRAAADGADRFVSDFQGQEGLIQRLIGDQAFAEEVGENLRQLIRNLNLVSKKLEQGDGSLGQLIQDPHLYQAMDDIVVGIDESKLLRWLIRNRQKKGIDKRFEDAGGDLATEPADSLEP